MRFNISRIHILILYRSVSLLSQLCSPVCLPVSLSSYQPSNLYVSVTLHIVIHKVLLGVKRKGLNQVYAAALSFVLFLHSADRPLPLMI